MKRLAIILLISALVPWTNPGLRAQENLSLSGYVRNYTGLLLEDPQDFSILQNTLDLTLESRSSRASFLANPYMYQYRDQGLEIGLREAYLDLHTNRFDLRVGKQQIIWGKAEGVFITDVVSPKDLQEFLLRDFDEIRMGITALKLDYYTGPNTFELVWAPSFTPTRMPEEGSIWAPSLDFPLAPSWDHSTAAVPARLENSEAFARYSLMASGFDLEVVGASFFYDDPAMHLTREVDPSTMQLTGLVVRPEYHRVAMAGGSVSVPLGDLVFRAEGAFYSGRHFQSTDPRLDDATLEKNNLHYMAGLDYSLAGIKLSAQFIQEHILSYEEGLYNEEFENTMTFLAKKDFFREKLWLELFSYIGLTHQDALIRPKLSYDLADGLELQAGANLFLGDSGRFGQYDANDMVYMKIKYSF